MPNTKTVRVPHLGGIDAAYQMPRPYDASKPTLVLVNSLTTSSELFQPQYADEKLNQAMNLIAIEPLGHGQTKTKRETWTFWDIAIMNLQVLDALGIDKAFALGTSQGGFIVVRMALLDPEKIEGVIPLGTAMDYESQRTRDLACWNGYEFGTNQAKAWAQHKGRADFQPEDAYCNAIGDLGFGAKACPPELRKLWTQLLRENFAGEDGRHRASMCVMNVAERDGLLGRLPYVRVPVLWLHGSEDPVFSVPNAEEEIKMFTGSPSAQLKVVDGGQHFLSGSHPQIVNQAAIDFVTKFHNSSIREATQTVKEDSAGHEGDVLDVVAKFINLRLSKI